MLEGVLKGERSTTRNCLRHGITNHGVYAESTPASRKDWGDLTIYLASRVLCEGPTVPTVNRAERVRRTLKILDHHV